jgi:hypothetical protein
VLEINLCHFPEEQPLANFSNAIGMTNCRELRMPVYDLGLIPKNDLQDERIDFEEKATLFVVGSLKSVIRMHKGSCGFAFVQRRLFTRSLFARFARPSTSFSR